MNKLLIILLLSACFCVNAQSNKLDANTTIGFVPIYAQDCTVNEKRANRIGIRKVRRTGGLDKSLFPCMTPSGVEKVVSIYLNKQLFPGISQPNNARIVAATLEPVLGFMTEEGRQKVLDVISEYY